MKTSQIFTTLFCLFSLPMNAYTQQKEAWYQDVWCKGMGGKVEYKLNDGRRVDCLTPKHAIEVEFARKWSEAIGQSLDYSMLTKRKAGIVLILQKQSDDVYWHRLHQVIHYYKLPVTAWKLGP
ncbi:MAG: hypothetical protein PUP46_03190 [Endozoicomonas sp. (ex Botrylloides leachii)]|nr:hypothetical protein [Endozoicomonas sp. (ex Botrylloides leachii)]